MKTLISVCLLVILLGCFANIQDGRVMPGWVQYMQDNIDGVQIVDWREDGVLAWVWCDNYDMPGDCDYVAILEIVSLERHEYSDMFILGKQNMPSGFDVCRGAYEIYENYLEGAENLLQEGEI
jgi:hypothetical protein